MGFPERRIIVTIIRYLGQESYPVFVHVKGFHGKFIT